MKRKIVMLSGVAVVAGLFVGRHCRINDILREEYLDLSYVEGEEAFFPQVYARQERANTPSQDGDWSASG